MSYDRGEDAPEESVTAGEWTDALCLAVLRDRVPWHGEAFRFARDKFAERTRGTPVGEPTTGLMAVVLDDTGNEDDCPPSAGAKLSALDAALDRVRARAEETGESLPERPGSAALHALRALVAEDGAAFDAAPAGLLTRHAALHSASATPAGLLPLVPLALAALAYRTLGWSSAVRTDYLPRALVTGLERRSPRVAGFGRDRRPDAVSALAAGPLAVECPAFAWRVHREAEALYEKHVADVLATGGGAPGG